LKEGGKKKLEGEGQGGILLRLGLVRIFGHLTFFSGLLPDRMQFFFCFLAGGGNKKCLAGVGWGFLVNFVGGVAMPFAQFGFDERPRQGQAVRLRVAVSGLLGPRPPTQKLGGNMGGCGLGEFFGEADGKTEIGTLKNPKRIGKTWENPQPAYGFSGQGAFL